MHLSSLFPTEIWGAALIALLLPFVTPSVTTASTMLIFAISACACNLLLGYTGLLSFAQSVFFGLGAYAAGLVMLHVAPSIWYALGAGISAGVIGAVVVGALSIRRQGIYFIMITVACGQMAYFGVASASWLTGGEDGLRGIPRPSIGIGQWTVPLDNQSAFYWFAAVVFLVALVVMRCVVNSAFGRVLVAIRDNEERARAVGYNTSLFKLQAFLISGAVTGLAGSVYAMFLRSVPASSVDFQTAEIIVIMAILGGTGSLLGPVLGAVTLIALSEQLSHIWPHWPLVIGAILIAIVLSGQNGIWALLCKAFGFVHAPSSSRNTQSPSGKSTSGGDQR